MSKDRSREQPPAPAASRPEIAEFIKRVRGLGPAAAGGKRGRLIFALDATMSRQPTWHSACIICKPICSARQPRPAGSIFNWFIFVGLGECRASGWVAGAEKLAALMSRIHRRGGHTQIGKVLSHARKEYGKQRVQALVFVGDAMEEKIDDLCAAAGELGLLGVPVFMFQEGGDPVAENAYREIARLSRGAYCRFDTWRGPPTRRIAARGRRLCRRRHQGTDRFVGAALGRRAQIAGATSRMIPKTCSRRASGTGTGFRKRLCASK